MSVLCLKLNENTNKQFFCWCCYFFLTTICEYHCWCCLCCDIIRLYLLWHIQVNHGKCKTFDIFATSYKSRKINNNNNSTYNEACAYKKKRKKKIPPKKVSWKAKTIPGTIPFSKQSVVAVNVTPIFYWQNKWYKEQSKTR